VVQKEGKEEEEEGKEGGGGGGGEEVGWRVGRTTGLVERVLYEREKWRRGRWGNLY